ncbi:HNH endonuclease signature motif containing protein [Nocardia sp. NPDC004711]
MTEIRYREGGDNRILRMALYDVYRSRCYWCEKPVDFNATEIDHILPRTATQARLDKLADELLNPAVTSYDVHDPYNLAPICGPCNLRKSAIDFTPTKRVMQDLQTAHTLRRTVVSKVEAFATAGKVTRAATTVIAADLKDRTARRALEDLAPQIIQKIALMDSELADGFLTIREFPVGEFDANDPEARHEAVVTIRADASTRRTLHLLEDMCAASLGTVLAGLVGDLREQLADRARSDLEAVEVPGGNPNVGEPESSVYVLIDAVTMLRDRAAFEFVFRGRFDITMLTSVLIPSEDGSLSEEVQGEAGYEGTVQFPVWWNALDEAAVITGESVVGIDHSEVDIIVNYL